MPWTVVVSMASGRTAEVHLPGDPTATPAVRALATEALGCRVVALVDADGRRLPESCPDVRELGLSDGAALTAVGGQVAVCGTRGARRDGNAFAALAGGVLLATWGAPSVRGDAAEVRAHLGDSLIVQVCATSAAFAAVTECGRVVAWGEPKRGGVVVRGVLDGGVREVYANGFAFVAVSHSGRVLAAWGDELHGGDCSQVCTELDCSVWCVYPSNGAFAALREDGRVVAWGNSHHGGDCSGVQVELADGVQCIYATTFAFAAVKTDGRAVTWGQPGSGGDSSAVRTELCDVRHIAATTSGFAAITGSGSVVMWGPLWFGACEVQAELEDGVRHICCTSMASAALKSDGRVVTWGSPALGGNSSAVAAELQSGVQRLYPILSGAFAAVTDAGRAVTWGSPLFGGDSSAVQSELVGGVRQVCATQGAFAALVEPEGKVVAWGAPELGGTLSGAAALLQSGVLELFSTTGAFAAVKSAGEVVTWGERACGGLCTEFREVAAVLQPWGGTK